jgi:hypothetical protein
VKDDNNNVVSFRVTSREDFTNRIIPHFSKYPLLTQKAADFKLFLQVIELMKNKDHLTMEGLQAAQRINNQYQIFYELRSLR